MDLGWFGMTQVWSEEARTTKLNSRWTSIGTTVSTAESKSFQMARKCACAFQTKAKS